MPSFFTSKVAQAIPIKAPLAPMPVPVAPDATRAASDAMKLAQQAAAKRRRTSFAAGLLASGGLARPMPTTPPTGALGGGSSLSSGLPAGAQTAIGR